MDSQATPSSDFKAMAQDVKDLKNDSAAFAIHTKDRAADAVNGTLGRIEETVSDIWGTISKRGTQSYEAVERNVVQRPVASVLAAFVAGAAIGWVLDRRR